MGKNATDLTQIENQIKDMESHNDLSDKKIKELDSGSQALWEKLITTKNMWKYSKNWIFPRGSKSLTYLQQRVYR